MNKVKLSPSRRFFNVINVAILLFLTLMCVLPFLHVIAVSFSEKVYVAAGRVTLWPVGFSTSSYDFLFTRATFWNSFFVSIRRLIYGTAINLFCILLTAYPLSKSDEKLSGRLAYAWFFFITMLIGGGLIPNYLLITKLKLRDTMLALILPGALPVFNLVLMLNFFRQVPKELEEAAMIDGAGHVRTLVQVYIPVSTPAIATIALFCMVNHWNSWFDGLIYIRTLTKVPLQTYLRSVIINLNMTDMISEDWQNLQLLSDRALRCAQIVIATIPILAVYPFLQRYFVSGIVLGSVKG